MTRPGYYLGPEVPENRVPGVTGLMAFLRRPEPLMAWAAKETRAGRDYRDSSQRAADAGTLAHRAVYAHLHGQPWDWDAEYLKRAHDIAESAHAPDLVKLSAQLEWNDVIIRAKKAFDAFLSWQATTALVCEAGEVRLISPTYRCGGTFDGLLSHGKRVMAEWKTADALYPEHLVQIRAYGALWEEAHPDEPVQGYLLGRFDKTTGDYHIHHFEPPLTEALEAFQLCRRLYDLERACRERLR